MAEEKEEKKSADQTADPRAPEETKKEDSAETESKTSDKDKKSDENIDYKAELEATRKRLGQAEYTIEELRKKKDSEEKSSSEDYDSADIDKKISEGISKATSSLQETVLNNVIDAELDRLSDNPDEKDLILLHYRNSIKRTGTSRNEIREDLENARLLANKKTLRKKFEEINHAAKSAITRNRTGYASGQSADEEGEVVLTEADKLVMDQFGIKASDIKPSE